MVVSCASRRAFHSGTLPARTSFQVRFSRWASSSASPTSAAGGVSRHAEGGAELHRRELRDQRRALTRERNGELAEHQPCGGRLGDRLLRVHRRPHQGRFQDVDLRPLGAQPDDAARTPARRLGESQSGSSEEAMPHSTRTCVRDIGRSDGWKVKKWGAGAGGRSRGAPLGDQDLTRHQPPPYVRRGLVSWAAVGGGRVPPTREPGVGALAHPGRPAYARTGESSQSRCRCSALARRWAASLTSMPRLGWSAG